MTPHSRAVSRGHRAITRLLLEKEVDPNTSLMVVVWHEMLKLCKKDVNPDSKNDSGRPPIEEVHKMAIKLLL